MLENRCSLGTVTTFNFTFKRLVLEDWRLEGGGGFLQFRFFSFFFFFFLSLPPRRTCAIVIVVYIVGSTLLTKNRKVAEDNFLIYSIKRHCNEKSETFRTCAVLTIITGRPTSIETENNGRKRFT